NSTGSTDSDSGTMAAAPSPSSARAAMSAPADPEYAQATDATPNNTSEMSSTFFRPYRSPSSPAGSKTAASTSVYASTNHCRPLVEAFRSAASVGSARLSTVRPSPPTSTASASPMSAHHLRVPAASMLFTISPMLLSKTVRTFQPQTMNRYQTAYSGSVHKRGTSADRHRGREDRRGLVQPSGNRPQ